MTLFEIILLAFALALDAMTVSFSYGLVISEKRIINSLKLSVAFGFFQFIMPIAGWFMAGSIYNYVKEYAKWIVFTIFIFLGIKFLLEAFNNKEDDNKNCISFLCLLSLAIATSIDALGAGISIRMTDINIIIPSCLIGIITFILSISGFFIAGILCKINNKIMGIIAAVIFVYLAIKSVL